MPRTSGGTQPGNEYLSISERPAWEALGRLAQIHPRLAHYTLRAACGLAPVPQTEKVVAWLRGDHACTGGRRRFTERCGKSAGPVDRQPAAAKSRSVGGGEFFGE